MTRRILIGAAALVAAAVPASASADGNVATGSVGSTQVGSTASSPTISGPVGTTVTVPVTVLGSGGNTATRSIGTVQAGDGNSAAGSVGSAQVSAVNGAPSAGADARVARASVSAPAGIPGSGPNDARRSVVTVQVGGGHSTSESLAQTQVNQADAQPGADVSTGTGTLVQLSTLGQPNAVLLLGPPKPRLRLAAALTRDFTFDPANLLFQATAVGIRPDILAAVDPIAALTFGGTLGTGPNGGNTAPDSLGTAQIGSVTLAPVVGLDSTAFGTGAAVGGSSGVDGAGTNLADPSLGTVQAGGGNTASDSAGTAQIGGLTVGPTGLLRTPFGAVALGGASGIAGGSNSASRSLGTLQIGGGNSSNGSAGTAQVGSASIGPTASSSGTPAGDASVGGSSGVSGNGNDANGSLGTAQVGGGNGAARSGGTLQSSGVRLGQTATAGGVTVGAPTTVGGGGGNSANGSLGTVQVGGSSQSSAEQGPTARSLSSGTPTALPARSGRAAAPRATAEKPSAAARRTASPAQPSHHTLGAHASRSGTLPFTGVDLIYAVLGGIALVGLGVGLRRRSASA
jgi:hypothetical protein